jgi:hypothetical protein
MQATSRLRKKIIKMLKFAAINKANTDTGLNFAAVKHTTVQVTRLLL